MYLLQDEPERRGRRTTLGIGAAITLCAVAGGIHGATRLGGPTSRIAPVPLSMTVVAAPIAVAAARKAPAEVEDATVDRPPPVRKLKNVAGAAAQPRKAATPASSPLPPTPNVAAAGPALAPAPAPLRLGISLSSVVSARGGATAAGPGRGPGQGVVEGQVAAPAGSSDRGPGERREATLKSRVTPSYPLDARELGIEGVVVIALTIAADGHVEGARLLRGLGHGLDDAALTASRNTRWSPATRDGRPVRSQRRFNVRFTLDG